MIPVTDCCWCAQLLYYELSRECELAGQCQNKAATTDRSYLVRSHVWPIRTGRPVHLGLRHAYREMLQSIYFMAMFAMTRSTE